MDIYADILEDVAFEVEPKKVSLLPSTQSINSLSEKSYLSLVDLSLCRQASMLPRAAEMLAGPGQAELVE